jgi:hypothetical protein
MKPTTIRRCWLIGAFLAIVAGCSAQPNLSESPQALKFFDGREGIEPILRPTKVEVFRTGSPREAAEARLEQATTIGGCPVKSGPLELDTRGTLELTRILANGRYGTDSPSACEFTPGVAFRFVTDSSTVELLVCFQCAELGLVQEGKLKIERFTTPDLVPLVQRLFPNDEEIQRLGKAAQ